LNYTRELITATGASPRRRRTRHRTAVVQTSYRNSPGRMAPRSGQAAPAMIATDHPGGMAVTRSRSHRRRWARRAHRAGAAGVAARGQARREVGGGDFGGPSPGAGTGQAVLALRGRDRDRLSARSAESRSRSPKAA